MYGTPAVPVRENKNNSVNVFFYLVVLETDFFFVQKHFYLLEKLKLRQTKQQNL